jgi:hypothetical protein
VCLPARDVISCNKESPYGTYIVIPGRPDVPIFENGVDVSWSVVEGEYGVDRPNIVNPTIIYRMPPVVVPYPGRAALGPISRGMGWRPAMAVSRSCRRQTAHCRAKPKATAALGGWSRRPRRLTFRRTIRTPSRR